MNGQVISGIYPQSQKLEPPCTSWRKLLPSSFHMKVMCRRKEKLEWSKAEGVWVTLALLRLLGVANGFQKMWVLQFFSGMSQDFWPRF